MGSQTSKYDIENNSDDEILNKIMVKKIQEDYTVQKYNFNDGFYGTVDVYKQKKNEQFHVAVKSILSTNHEQFDKTTAQFLNRFAKLNHPNLITLQGFQMVADSTFCSKMFKHVLYLEFIDKTLEDEMIQMGQNQFNEDDIWFFIDSIVGGLTFLAKKGLKHESLCLANIYSVTTPQNVKLFKIADSILMNYITNYQIALRILDRHDEDKSELKGIYLSPEQLIDLQNRVKHPTYDPNKSDVFTLGMLILDMAIWGRLDVVYNWQYCKIDENILNQTIQTLVQKQQYSDELIKVINLMLQMDPERRTDFAGLDSYLSRNVMGKGKRVSDHIQPGNYRIITEKDLTEELNIIIEQRQQKQMKKIEKSRIEGENDQNQQNNSPQQQQSTIQQIQQNTNAKSQYQQQVQPFSPNKQSNQQKLIQQSQYLQTQGNQNQQQLSQNFGVGMHGLIDAQNLTPEQQFLQQQLIQTQMLQQQQQQQIFAQFQALQQQQQAFAMQQQQQQFQQQQFQTPDQNQQSLNTLYNNNNQYTDPLGTNLQTLTNPNINTQQNIDKQLNFEDFNLKNQFAVINYPNGSTYEGNVFQDQRNGMGTLTFPDSGSYQGEWKMNKMHGKGTLYYKDNIKAYEGEWYEDKFHKFGNLYNNTAQQIQDNFDYRNFANLGEAWESYQGDFDMDLRHGFGVLHLTNGEKYAGNFKQDKVHGYGTFYTIHGEIVNGYWENDVIQRIL